jgi:hypothetical protein
MDEVCELPLVERTWEYLLLRERGPPPSTDAAMSAAAGRVKLTSRADLAAVVVPMPVPPPWLEWY